MASTNLLSRTAQRLLSCRSITLTNTKHSSLWTADKIVKSPHKDVNIPNRTVPEHIWENMERWADKTALVCIFLLQCLHCFCLVGLPASKASVASIRPTGLEI